MVGGDSNNGAPMTQGGAHQTSARAPAVQIVPAVQWFGRSRSLTAGFLDGLQFRARRGITMTGSIFRSS